MFAQIGSFAPGMFAWEVAIFEDMHLEICQIIGK
jgi:hypothetical protein